MVNICDIIILLDNDRRVMIALYDWLESVIEKEYCVEKIIKVTEDKSIALMKNNRNSERVLVRKYMGSSAVYKALTKINHINLPIVYEAVSDGDKSLVVEEYIEGLTVEQILETGRYTAAGVEDIIIQLAEALDVLHENNIVHRDIKPENIIVNNEGVVKLIDYNISRIYDNSSDKDTRILGTTGFAAPEQYGIAETDPRADIYAIGILINVMLTGEHPAKKLCEGRWKRIVNKCTRINPNERFNKVKDIIK